ncbi:MAG: hypothetical protein BMS9Abin07_0332 [Acidimicrobiia bacterium]|nr:MAG: hypothetical protein BMS9Abin07_0332 [Acidimicrobiia bacterium]
MNQRGVSRLEWLALLGLLVILLVMIPFVRETAQDLVGRIYNRVDDAGELTDFSVMMRGLTVTIAAVATFIGAIWLVLSTNVGSRLSFLIVGAAAFGWLTIGGVLFTVYAPRGIRPADIEGLNALQVRVPAIAMAVGAFILFVMFALALDRYERDVAE